MAFGHKDPGLNNTTKKRMRKLVDMGYSPKEISDDLNVVLPCVMSFYKDMTGMDEDEIIEKFGEPVEFDPVAAAQAEADSIIAAAKAKAAAIEAGEEDEAEEDEAEEDEAEEDEAEEDDD